MVGLREMGKGSYAAGLTTLHCYQIFLLKHYVTLSRETHLAYHLDGIASIMIFPNLMNSDQVNEGANFTKSSSICNSNEQSKVPSLIRSHRTLIRFWLLFSDITSLQTTLYNEKQPLVELECGQYRDINRSQKWGRCYGNTCRM